MTYRTLVAVPLAILLAACGAEGDSSPRGDTGMTVRDSAGIRIVENVDSAWTEETRWQLAEEPDFVIGSFDGSVPGTDWGNLLQARAAGERIVVADLMSPGFRVFDDEGVWVETLGRQGEGPLELESGGEWTVIGDSPLASDFTGNKVVVFDLASSEASSYRVEDPPVDTETWAIGGFEIGWQVVSWLGDGSYILGNTPDPRGLESGFSTLLGEYHRMSSEGEYLGSLGTWPASRVFTHPDGETAIIPFQVMPHTASSGDTFWHAFADSLFEVRRIDGATGQLDMLLRVEGRAQRVTEEMMTRLRRLEERQIDDLIAQSGGEITEEMVDRMRSTMAQLRARQPDQRWAPSIFGLRALGSGHLLVDLPEWEWHMQPNQLLMGNVPDDEAVSFAVFDPAGVWLGTFEAPVGLVVSDVTDEYVVGYLKDEFDVPYIERWRIIRP